MNDLTVNDIHKIREEHAVSTRNMSFDEYKKHLHQDVQPLLDLLKSMKRGQKNAVSYSVGEQPNVAAEPEIKYKRHAVQSQFDKGFENSESENEG